MTETVLSGELLPSPGNTPAPAGSGRYGPLSAPDAPTGADEGATVDQLVNRWLVSLRSAQTRRAYAGDITGWLGYCAASDLDPVTEIRNWHVHAYARAAEATGYAPSTVTRRLAAISSWYRWLIRERYVHASPTAGVDRPRVDPDHSTTIGLAADLAAQLVAAADTDPHPAALRTTAAIATLLYTGVRVGELVGADVDDLRVDAGHRVLDVVRKGGRRGRVVVPPPAATRLDIYLATRTNLFPTALPALYAGAAPRRPLLATATGNRLSAGEIWRTLRRVAAAAGDDLADLAAQLSPHSLRHILSA